MAGLLPVVVGRSVPAVGGRSGVACGIHGSCGQVVDNDADTIARDGATEANDATRGDERRLLLAARVVDADRVDAAPGAVLLAPDGAVEAAGSPEAVGRPADAAVETRTGHVLTPPLVNAHVHLDLTAVGPVAFDGDFPAWLAAIRGGRPDDPAALAAAVREGARRSVAGGVALVADIAGLGSPVPTASLREAAASTDPGVRGIGGTSFREILGFGDRVPPALAAVEAAVAEAAGAPSHGVALGLQPHAPFSCGPEVFTACAASGLPVSTHLAETDDEVRFSRAGDGPLADLLRRLGVGFDPAQAATGRHPVDALADALAAVPWIVAHANHLEDAHLERLAAWRTTVAFCPRATACFGRRGPRWRALLDAGVRVALGTDGVPCLDRTDRISTLDEARLLWRHAIGDADARSPVAARTLLGMATVAGAEGLGVDADRVRFVPGPSAGVLAHASPDGRLETVLERDDAPVWLAGPGAS